MPHTPTIITEAPTHMGTMTRHTHSTPATQACSHWLQLQPPGFPRSYSRDSEEKLGVRNRHHLHPAPALEMPPTHQGLRPNLALHSHRQPQQVPTLPSEAHSQPFSCPPPVTYHPKPPKETLRFLRNMVVATRPRVPVMSPGLLAKGPRRSRVGGATGIERDMQCGTSPIACPPTPALPVGEAAGLGGVSCPPGDSQQGSSQRAASPRPEEPAAPERARLADCTTAQVGSSVPHSPGFPEPKGG